MQCHSRVSRTQERRHRCHTTRSQLVVATPEGFHLGLLGALGQHGKGGQREEDQEQLDMYINTHMCRPKRFLTELVLLRFQQSGLSLFCSSARALASMVYILLSSFFIFFHLSPRMTLMALEQVKRRKKDQKGPDNGETKKGTNTLWNKIYTVAFDPCKVNRGLKHTVRRLWLFKLGLHATFPSFSLILH